MLRAHCENELLTKSLAPTTLRLGGSLNKITKYPSRKKNLDLLKGADLASSSDRASDLHTDISRVHCLHGSVCCDSISKLEVPREILTVLQEYVRLTSTPNMASYISISICACLCLCLYLYLSVHVYVYVYIYIYLCMSTSMFISICACLCLCLYLSVHVYVYVYIYIYLCMSMSMFISICACLRLCLYLCY